MWKSIINQLENYQKTLSLKDYCLSFIALLGTKESLLSREEMEAFLEKNNDSSLFPQFSNLHKCFNTGELKSVISYIYHFESLDNSWMDILNELNDASSINSYESIFNKESELFLFKQILFLPEYLLSENDYQRELTFLFLFFLPTMNGQDLLYPHAGKKSLLTYSAITNEHFDMLLFLMERYCDEFKSLLNNKNLNHLLIEDFIMNSTLYDWDEEIDWNDMLPIYKIHKLLGLNCRLGNLSQTIDGNLLYMFKGIEEKLAEIERKFFYDKLNSELKSKTPSAQEKVQKV